MYEKPDDEFEEEDDEDDTPAAFVPPLMAQKNIELEFAGKLVSLTLDGKNVAVPSIGYVRELEQVVAAQAKQILRMTAEMKRIRQTVNSIIGDINNVHHELDRKIDMGRDKR